jgi:hypothetical protein
MADDKPATPPPQPSVHTASATTPATLDSATESGPTINIGDEFGTAKRNLPPPKVLAIGLALILAVSAIIVFTQSRPTSSGSIDDVNAVEIPDQNSVLATINVTIQNNGKKAIWIHTMSATLETSAPDATAKTEFTDEAGSPADFERYFQAFPELKRRAIAPLQVETKIQPGDKASGTIIVSFPVTKDAFDKRKSIAVTIRPYDQIPVTLKSSGA